MTVMKKVIDVNYKQWFAFSAYNFGKREKHGEHERASTSEVVKFHGIFNTNS